MKQIKSRDMRPARQGPETRVHGEREPEGEQSTAAEASSDVARRRWTLALAGLGAFLCSLDVVVVATALPTLQSELGAQLSDLEWTINAYNLAFACLMLTGSAMGDRFGRRTMYIAGLGVFTAASVACALAASTEALIVARTVQGAGAAVVLPLTLTLISDAFPLAKRGVAIGIWGGITGLGVAAGPVLGGAITEGVSWQWIFWINVPVGLAMIPLSAWWLRQSYGPRPHLDIIGLVLAGIGLCALTWAPVRAPAVGWGSAEVVLTAAAGVLFVIAFLAWERRARYPMLPLEYFALRGFSAANGVIFFQFLSLLGALFMITQLFQVGLGNTPLEAGLRILVWTGMPMIVAPIAGALAERIGTRPFMVGGLILQAAGLGWLAAVVETGVAYSALVVPLIVAGAGIGMIFATTASAATAAVPVDDTGVAAGTNTAFRELGGVFGIAILAAVFARYGGYASPADFIAGFEPAMWTAAAVPLLGLIAAAFAPPKAAVPAERRGPLPGTMAGGPVPLGE
ncbi:MFS transporter [Nocardia sp. NPDC051750]|uniref:MFS transporter n=1 Tax=Nocardia sp. NPDC051750 TaxID=3364325 RepID=UPI00378E32F8